MTTETAPPPPHVQQHEFQTETRQLLKLMIHSLYSNKEIFLRELISNASDAADKLRFLSLQDPTLLDDGDAELAVDLIVDAAAGTLTIRDNGIGMSRQDLVDNLGTIARSGTKAFMEQLSAEGKKDAQLIGQFGVGFYSAFIVADRVTVTSRRAADAQAHVWESTGEGSYSLEPAEKASRGTDITLHLRDDEKEFLESGRLSHLVRKYSDHIGLPVRLTIDGGERETLNKAAALWTRPKSELSDDDYTGFYTHLSHDPERPLTWSHQRVEGSLSYISLLYIPSAAPFDLWDRDKSRGLQLYVKRVFIMDHGAELLPAYLRFVRGLVDSDDLPLNVSRELLQGNRSVEKLKSALTKRVLDLLDDMARTKPDDYAKFYDIFGAVLKEGLVEDQANRERIARLCRFDSTASVDGAKVALADYVARMPEGQSKIYYVTADSPAAARAVPHVEGFRKKGWEVLLLSDRIDEWVVMHLHEFDGKRLESCAAGGADLESAIATPEKEQAETEFAPLLARLGKSLAGKVALAKLSSRLVESPACLVVGDYGFSRRLEKILKQAGQAAPALPPVLEINPAHPLVERLKTATDTEFDDLAAHLYDQSVLAEGGQLEDPAAFVRRLNALILSGAQPAEAGRIIAD
jgi:molecular chaperone HtpG